MDLNNFLPPLLTDQSFMAKIPQFFTTKLPLAFFANNEPLQHSLRQSQPFCQLQHHFQQQLYHKAGTRYVRLNLETAVSDPIAVQNLATLLCFAAGDPILLYDKEPFWEPLRVDLEAQPNRTHGVGQNPMHIDLVNRERPPELIAFLGVRPDPLGGGYTELGNLETAVAALPKQSQELLAKPIFTYWKDKGVRNIGQHLPYFSIIPQPNSNGYIRFTSKMLPHLDGTDTVIHPDYTNETEAIKKALNSLYEHLCAHQARFLVDKNHLVFFNQRVMAHCRSELGANQNSIPDKKRRLMRQAYLHKPV